MLLFFVLSMCVFGYYCNRARLQRAVSSAEGPMLFGWIAKTTAKNLLGQEFITIFYSSEKCRNAVNETQGLHPYCFMIYFLEGKGPTQLCLTTEFHRYQ